VRRHEIVATKQEVAAIEGGLFVNPRSGGGKAQRYDLVAQCRARGIEPVVMKEGDDLASLSAAAVSSGADVIGMAGGDGSQAIVAAVASRRDIPYVCIPAGTRNHFALDVGVDRDDVIGSLDAFQRGSERRIDLAQVNGRVFVNNASIGFYGKVVQSPEYRDAKLRTVIEMLPDLLGPGAAPFDLRFSDPSGAEYESAQLVLVSNNRYQLDPLGTQGTRGGWIKGRSAWSWCRTDRS
jgi:Diacylglycerol kinase catalytic domain